MAKRLGHILSRMRDIFGIQRLRPGQDEVIQSVLGGRHTLAIMPTGAGKSLCYQLPALHLPGTTVVASPLISLMKDQTDKLREAGVSAAMVNSALTVREAKHATGQIESAQTEFVLTTPECLADPDFVRSKETRAHDLLCAKRLMPVETLAGLFRRRGKFRSLRDLR